MVYDFVINIFYKFMNEGSMIKIDDIEFHRIWIGDNAMPQHLIDTIKFDIDQQNSDSFKNDTHAKTKPFICMSRKLNDREKQRFKETLGEDWENKVSFYEYKEYFEAKLKQTWKLANTSGDDKEKHKALNLEFVLDIINAEFDNKNYAFASNWIKELIIYFGGSNANQNSVTAVGDAAVRFKKGCFIDKAEVKTIITEKNTNLTKLDVDTVFFLSKKQNANFPNEYQPDLQSYPDAIDLYGSGDNFYFYYLETLDKLTKDGVYLEEVTSFMPLEKYIRGIEYSVLLNHKDTIKENIKNFVLYRKQLQEMSGNIIISKLKLPIDILSKQSEEALDFEYVCQKYFGDTLYSATLPVKPAIKDKDCFIDRDVWRQSRGKTWLKSIKIDGAEYTEFQRKILSKALQIVKDQSQESYQDEIQKCEEFLTSKKHQDNSVQSNLSKEECGQKIEKDQPHGQGQVNVNSLEVGELQGQIIQQNNENQNQVKVEGVDKNSDSQEDGIQVNGSDNINTNSGVQHPKSIEQDNQNPPLNQSKDVKLNEDVKNLLVKNHGCLFGFLINSNANDYTIIGDNQIKYNGKLGMATTKNCLKTNNINAEIDEKSKTITFNNQNDIKK